MRWFATVQTALLIAAPALAAPLDSELHFLGKRDAVCSVDFRRLVDFDSCLPKKVAFTSVPPAVTKVTLPDALSKSVPADSQCDHAVELQVLDFVAKQAKLCEVLTAMANAGQTKDSLLGPASQTISALPNLNFLNKVVNNNKRVVVQRGLNGKAQGKEPADLAVGNYLALVKTDTVHTAAALDADIAKIITTAEGVLAKLPDGTSKRGDKDRIKKDALKTALANYDKTKTVTAAWNNVLTKAPHS
ncbi:hypothetical protein PHLCEN_2v8228 [Hermanssonia centrifuga]|uniref:Uncharacterized protein n=1 Tax=Hermanssonia centrifuga TaxID=98765 RepID=A0A2R6NUE7_9APHY|nr:hypothetical protein PHLCEN_2v8228 [Hermanssonia centrifuga]